MTYIRNLDKPSFGNALCVSVLSLISVMKGGTQEVENREKYGFLETLL